MSDTDSLPVPVEDVKTIIVDDTVVLVDQRSGQYFGLNEIGATIWRLLAVGNEEDAIIQALLKEYDVDEGVVVEDLQRICHELAEAGLVH